MQVRDPSQLQPIGDKLIIKELAPGKTEAGLIVPEEAAKPLPMAKVIAVGPDVRGFEAGDFVILNKYINACAYSQVIHVNHEPYGVVRARSIAAKVAPA